MTELQQLRTFCAVVEKKSFTKAGEIVYRAQSTISDQILALEKAYGTTLLDRSRREIITTESGEILYHYAKKILKLVQEARDKIDELKQIVKGELTIGASTIPGTYILPKILKDLKDKYPQIHVLVQILNSKEVIERIIERTLEVGVVGRKVEDQRLRYKELAKDRIILVVSPSHQWTNLKSITIDMLKKEPFIHREPGSGTRVAVELALKAKGIKKLNVVMTFGSTEAIKEAVKTGLGVSFISEWANKEGILKEVKVEDLDIFRHFYLVFLQGKAKGRVTEAFIDFVSARR